MRRLAILLGLGALLAACSQPDFYEMRPTSLSFETKGMTRTVRAVAKDRRGNEHPTSKPLEWKSSDEKVATVDAKGVVTAVGSGVATIKAIRGDLVGEVMVDVNAVEKLVVEPATEIRLEQDGKPYAPVIKTLDIRGKELTGRMVRVKCADEKICTTDGDKRIWAHNPGETTYELNADGLKQTVKVVVEAAKRR
ncbi:Ig domain-containing protein [Vulgatibacter sp.]|uniref:Ig-like domain-containing protein n=1 Tax=Vulgatibacter sp. TaxID=1971226 RepID=UPI00356320D9